jgi:hypothetical protein
MFPVRFEVPRMALLRLKIFWDVTPCPDVLKEQVNFLFDQSTTEDEGCMFYCKENSSWTPLSLKMQAIHAFKTRVLLRTPDL